MSESDADADRLRDALVLMDERGRSIPGDSVALWRREWDELRGILFALLEARDAEVARLRAENERLVETLRNIASRATARIVSATAKQPYNSN